MKEKLRRFFAGRYGGDSLSKFTIIAALVLLIVSQFTYNVLNGVLSSVLWILSLAAIIYTYWRMLSRNVYKRSEENRKYLKLTRGIRNACSMRLQRFRQRKDFRFYKCPSCRAMLRVPKNKGKIQITCRKCGTRFIRKT